MSECYNCHEVGHISRNCPNAAGGGANFGSGNRGGLGGGGACYNCGQSGHFSRDCQSGGQGSVSGYQTFERSNRGRGSDRGCFNCGESGHMARDCTSLDQRGSSRGGGGGSFGGDRKCYNCGKPGHLSRDCQENPNAVGSH